MSEREGGTITILPGSPTEMTEEDRKQLAKFNATQTADMRLTEEDYLWARGGTDRIKPRRSGSPD